MRFQLRSRKARPYLFDVAVLGDDVVMVVRLLLLMFHVRQVLSSGFFSGEASTSLISRLSRVRVGLQLDLGGAADNLAIKFSYRTSHIHLVLRLHCGGEEPDERAAVDKAEVRVSLFQDTRGRMNGA